ncbi:leucine-rich melanocyte differentiation-associated protein-like isoform X2 [Cylas formicarius]|uniref:leucine-rich melanocyte differentiation-associated protein-like isoform X2 n=1 Tax=Cylas formicarius TaxID=197179 RepID=UPI002958B827|nr:leucine-rich melanocyte differentiation-associated protein-like isoform X2 [Cylas formicarius]
MAAGHVTDVMLPSSVTFVDNNLCYCGQSCRKIPDALCKLYGPKVHSLDLSYNELITLRGIDLFPYLRELILDNNQLGDTIQVPQLPHLHTLSLNKNNICDLESLLQQIKTNMPNMVYLSLLGNKACPHQLSGEENDDEDYQRYRYFVLHHLPNLKFLDSKKVSELERREARKRGKYMNVIKPKQMECASSAELHTHSKFNPLPKSLRGPNDFKGVYGKCRYRYSGKQSEGNRFILNKDL